MAEHNELGSKGEKLARSYLSKNGYYIRETNWRYQKAEVDIIAQKGAVLAIVEVKTRSTIDFGNPQDFVTAKKIQRLVKAINFYVVSRDLDVEVRFDIIGIVYDQKNQSLEHFKNAFYHF